MHNWVGGIMSDIMYSPCDPLFWLHHAFIDRVTKFGGVPTQVRLPSSILINSN